MVRDIAAGVGYSDGRFRVSGLGATTQWGRLQSANAELGAAAPHPLRVDATVRGEVARIAYDLALAANGDLEKAVASIDPVAGYGLGLRWRTPIGPVNLDVAYGQAESRYRVHFSIGYLF